MTTYDLDIMHYINELNSLDLKSSLNIFYLQDILSKDNQKEAVKEINNYIECAKVYKQMEKRSKEIMNNENTRDSFLKAFEVKDFFIYMDRQLYNLLTITLPYITKAFEIDVNRINKVVDYFELFSKLIGIKFSITNKWNNGSGRVESWFAYAGGFNLKQQFIDIEETTVEFFQSILSLNKAEQISVVVHEFYHLLTTPIETENTKRGFAYYKDDEGMLYNLEEGNADRFVRLVLELMAVDGYDFRGVDLQTKRKKEGEKRVTSILIESPQLFRGIYGTFHELQECIEEYNKAHTVSLQEEESRLVEIKEVPPTFGIE